MAVFDTISFPPTDFVTGLPTIDGWTGNADPGVAVHFPEPGFATGGRIAFSGGSIVPPVAFQCAEVVVTSPSDVGLTTLDPGNYLAMGFFCSFDPSFDQEDGLTIAILPDFADTTHTTARRIDLKPNTDGVGAGSGGAASDPLPGGVTAYNARLNRDLPSITAYKGVGPNTDPTAVSWSSIAVTNLATAARAASWHPSTVATNAKPSQNVTTSTFTLAVDDVSQFPDSGNLTVPLAAGGTVTVAYTGRNTGTNTFTGCTIKLGSSTGAVDTVPTIQLQDLGWSVEMLIPKTVALGGADWIDIGGHFGLYVNLYRWSIFQPSPPAQPHAGHLAAQYRFPLPDASALPADQHYITGFLGDTTWIGDDWYGKATIVSDVGTNDAQGVCFQNVGDPASSVGVRHPGSPDPTSLGLYVYGSTGLYDNTLVAQIQNTNPTNAATNVSAEFRFGKWGNPPTSFAQWDPATNYGATTPNVVASLAAAGGTAEITSTWNRADVSASPYVGDICMWVRLDSVDNTDFAQDGVRHNTIFTDLSEHEGDATVSGSGYPGSGPHHDFLLMTHVRELVALGRKGGDEQAAGIAATGGSVYEQVLGWYWLVETFRRTGLEMKVGDATAEIIDSSPGQFGAVARHDVKPGDVFMSQLSGGGIQRYGNGMYGLRVPRDGEVTIHTWMGAGPAGTLKPPTPVDQGGGCLGLLLPFLNWIKKLFK
jgi:hypothetical protein